MKRHSAPLLGLLAALCLLAACSTPRTAAAPSRAATTAAPTQATAILKPQATATTLPTPQWTATATPRPSETAAREATATPSVPASATPMPTSTTAVGTEPVAVLTGPGFDFEGWSPAGDVFAFRSFAAAQLQMGGPYPRGTWHFYEAGTGAAVRPSAHGEACQYLATNELGLDWNGWHAWLPDGGMLLFKAPPEGGPRELVRLHRPCSDVVTSLSGLFPEPVSVSASNAENGLFLLRGKDAFYLYEPLGGTARAVDALQGLALDGFSFSPGDVYLGATLATGTTYVVRVDNGQLEEVVPWSYSLGGLGDLGGPLWLNDGQFLVRRSDVGPLLVTLGSAPQPVAPTFFGQRAAPHQAVGGAGAPGSDAFYLILSDPGPEYTESRNWLYHSASGLVEALDASHAAIVAGGRWLSLLRTVDVEGYERTQVWVRPLEPAGAHTTILSGVGDAAYPVLSPKGTAIAVANQVGVGEVATLQLRSVPDGGVLQSWEVGNYNLFEVYWSPDGRHLVAIGQVPVLDDSQYFPWQRLYTLFLFPVEPSLAGTLEGREFAALPPGLIWAQYSDPALGFAVQYPGDWAVTASAGAVDGSGRSWSTIEFQSHLHAYDHQAFDMYTIRVAVAEGARETVAEAVDDTLRPVFAPVRDQVQRYCCRTVDGELAVELSGFPPGRWGSRQVVVLHEGREYWLTFYPQVGLNGNTPADAVGRAAFDTFLRSFAFIPVTATALPPAPTVTPVPTPS